MPLLTSCLCLSCGGGGASSSSTPSIPVPVTQPVSISITPTVVQLPRTGWQQFQAKVTNAADKSVIWKVNGIAGGNQTVGQITTKGLFDAPWTTAPTTATVTAVASADHSKTASVVVAVTLDTVQLTIAPSSKDGNLIWTGSDDGLVQVTRDGGKTWKNVTPKDLPEFARISLVEASPFRAGTAYVAANRYGMDYLRASTSMPFEDVILKYLRQGGLIK